MTHVLPDPHDDPAHDSLTLDARWITLVACGAAAVIGIAVAAQVYLSMLDHGHAFLRILAWQVSSWLFWGFAAPDVLRIGSGLSGSTGRSGRVRRVVSFGAGLCVLHMVVTAQLTVWLRPFLPIPGPGFGDAFLGQVPSVFLTDLLVFVLLLVAGSSLGAHHRARRLERREARLEVELARAQLDALRLEIHPHFLFNTLNSIAALIRVKDNSRALEMLLGLSELMRATVDGPRDHLVPLSTEIDFVRRYLDLQRARFADRLEIRWDVEPAALTVPVPTLVLQPLVENAIRHGTAPQSRRSAVTIAARVDGADLRMSVADDGVGLPAGFELVRDAGTGLGNTASRLKQLYGSRASLRVRPRDGGGTVVDLGLPTAPAMAPIRTIA